MCARTEEMDTSLLKHSFNHILGTSVYDAIHVARDLPSPWTPSPLWPLCIAMDDVCTDADVITHLHGLPCNCLHQYQCNIPGISWETVTLSSQLSTLTFWNNLHFTLYNRRESMKRTRYSFCFSSLVLEYLNFRNTLIQNSLLLFTYWNLTRKFYSFGFSFNFYYSVFVVCGGCGELVCVLLLKHFHPESFFIPFSSSPSLAFLLFC